MVSNVQIVQPEVKDLQVSSSDMVKEATNLAVSNDATFARGGEMLLEIKRRSRVVEERFAEPVSLAHKTHKTLTALRDSVLSPFRSAESMIKGKLGGYQAEIEKARRIEAERLQREAAAKAEADRIAKAQEQMDNGDLKGCEKTLEAPLKVEPVRISTPEPLMPEGISMRENWKFEITNVNEIPMDYLIPDEKAIGRVVKAMGTKTNIPGIRIWAEKVVSGRA